MASPERDVSVVVPTRNRARTLRQCLRALGAQTVSPGRFEIIVSDDGSSDDTAGVVEEVAAGFLPRLVYLRQPGRGASAARNRGIERAAAPLLLLINDDVIASKRLLEAHLQCHAEDPKESAGVLGRVTVSPDLPRSPFASLHLDAFYGNVRPNERLGWRHFITCNLSVKTSFLRTNGLFEESIPVQHEDLELGERLSHHGLTIRYCPDALAYHDHFIDERRFLDAAVQDGRSLALWYKKAPHLHNELASLGFYPPSHRRLRSYLGDAVVNHRTRPLLVRLARAVVRRNEPLALALYSKVYQSVKREAIRKELR